MLDLIHQSFRLLSRSELEKSETEKLADCGRAKSLSEMEDDSVFVIQDVVKMESAYGKFGISNITIPNDADEMLAGKLLIPERFLEEVERLVPAVFFYGGKLQLKGGNSCHNFCRCYLPSGKRYTAKYTPTHHMMELRRDTRADLRNMLNVTTLNKFAEGTVLVCHTLNYVRTKKNPKSPTVVYETVVLDSSALSGQKTITGRVFLPSRYERDFKRGIPLVVVYRGMKKTKNGRDFNDIQIVRSGYEESAIKDDVENDEEDVEVVWEEKTCAPEDECHMNGNTCYGFCHVCKDHQPFNGGQCKCVLK